MPRRQRLLARFRCRARAALEAAEVARRGRDAVALRRELHKVKGDARMLGFEGVAVDIQGIYDELSARLTQAESERVGEELERLHGWLDSQFGALPEPSPSSAPARRAGNDGLIFVVDDSPVARMMLVASLRARGAKAEGLDGAEQLFAAIAERRPRAVLTDIEMPGVGGFELLERLRVHHPKLPVVLFSADTDADKHARAAALGASGLFSKSTDLGGLLEYVIGIA